MQYRNQNGINRKPKVECRELLFFESQWSSRVEIDRQFIAVTLVTDDSVDPMQEKNPNEINRKPDVKCQMRYDQLDLPVRQLRSSISDYLL